MKKRNCTGIEYLTKCNNEVRSLDKRENPLKTRKGMKRTNNKHSVIDGIQIENPIYGILRAKRSL